MRSNSLILMYKIYDLLDYSQNFHKEILLNITSFNILNIINEIKEIVVF